MEVPKKLEKEGAALAIKKKSRGLQVGAGNTHEPALRPEGRRKTTLKDMEKDDIALSY